MDIMWQPFLFTGKTREGLSVPWGILFSTVLSWGLQVYNQLLSLNFCDLHVASGCFFILFMNQLDYYVVTRLLFGIKKVPFPLDNRETFKCCMFTQ